MSIHKLTFDFKKIKKNEVLSPSTCKLCVVVSAQNTTKSIPCYRHRSYEIKKHLTLTSNAKVEPHRQNREGHPHFHHRHLKPGLCWSTSLDTHLQRRLSVNRCEKHIRGRQEGSCGENMSVLKFEPPPPVSDEEEKGRKPCDVLQTADPWKC